MTDKKVAIIGECMLELSSSSMTGKALSFHLSYGGDTLNTAVYLARLGTRVDYFTALGDDGYSDWLLGQWRQEGIGCNHVQRVGGRLPGIYAIETDDAGERRFHYWRDRAPARELFDAPDLRTELFQTLMGFDLIYLSGITLSLYRHSVLEALFKHLQKFREQGGLVAFDGNFRPKRWPDSQRAQEVYDAMYRLTDIALPTFEDEQMLFQDASEQDVVSRLSGLGVGEIVLKRGLNGCLTVSDGTEKQIPLKQAVQAVDTTAAGDSFNAGYLATRIKGSSVEDSVAIAQALSATVVQNPGAIIAAELMPDLGAC